MTAKAEAVTSRDGMAGVAPGPAVRPARRRRPTGAPLPLPHPVSVSTTAWLAAVVVVLAGAIVVSVRAASLRLDDQANAAVLRVASAVIVTVFCLACLYLAVNHVDDLLLGVALGVAIPVTAFRFFTPNEAFPVAYRRGNTAHVDVTGRRGEAIRHGVRLHLHHDHRRQHPHRKGNPHPIPAQRSAPPRHPPPASPSRSRTPP